VAGQWFSPGTSISSTNITEALLKVALNTITPQPSQALIKKDNSRINLNTQLRKYILILNTSSILIMKLKI
jgi:hypothetical protein